MQCPECGAFYSEEDEFCGECGFRLRIETPRIESPSSPRGEDRATIKHAAGLRQPATPRVGPKASRSPSDLLPILGVVIVLLLFIGVCVAVLVIPITGKKPVAGPYAEPAQGELLYHEDFRDPASGWETWDSVITSVKYVDGELRLAVVRGDYMAWSHAPEDRQFRDFAVEVDVRQVEGNLNSTFGPIVRYDLDRERYYWFQIRGDGYYWVEENREGEWIVLQEWEASDAIKKGLDATNHIRVVCDGDRFSFYVNDTLVTELTDGTLRAGTVGLAAGTGAEPPVVVLFDNLSVYALED